MERLANISYSAEFIPKPAPKMSQEIFKRLGEGSSNYLISPISTSLMVSSRRLLAYRYRRADKPYYPARKQ